MTSSTRLPKQYTQPRPPDFFMPDNVPLPSGISLTAKT
jgi:hypothetical protein